MEYIKLNNGIKMPKLGFGVYQIPKSETKQCVLDALEVGFRSIDTAQGYNNEKEVGDAIKQSNIKREDIFLTTKIWTDNFGHEKTKVSLENSFRKLQVEYIDLVLIHHPFSDYYGAYKALEEYYKLGKIKAIGVSNFSNDRLADIIAFNNIKPAINQIEINPFYQRNEEKVYQKEAGVQLEAWAPFGEGRNNMFTNPTLTKIASKLNKSVAQIILRWLLDQNIVVVCKTTHKSRMIENYNVFDFNLDDQDIQDISKLNTNSSLFFEDNTVSGVSRMLDVIAKRRIEFSKTND